MKINWYKVQANLTAKVGKNNIILNANCMKIATEYAYCRIGTNDGTQLFIQPINYNKVEDNEFDGTLFRIYNTRTYSRISCTDFINSLSSKYKLDFTTERKYTVSWDETTSLFTVDLKSEVIDDE